MKIHLKQIFSENLISTQNNTTNNLSSMNISNLRMSSNRYSEETKPDLILNCDKYNSETLPVVYLKNFIANHYKINIENISIFIHPSYDQDNSYGLSDEFDIFKLDSNKSIKCKYLSIVNTLNTYNSSFLKDRVMTLYFKKNQDFRTCKIIIEYFIKNVDRILLEISMNCSIYILKFMIKNKLGIPEEEQIFYDCNNQRQFKNDELIMNILNTSNDLIGSNIQLSYPRYSTSTKIKEENYSAVGNSNCEIGYLCPSKALKIRLIRKGNKKCSIGIDFSFNLLKNINKINFSEEAPSFREASDGLNLICYCRNNCCRIQNDMFVYCLGYGKYEIIREIAFIKCPGCNSTEIECKNLGFINCIWSYRGILANKKNCYVSGDGTTIDQKLYILNEVSLYQYLEKLEISIKEKKIKNEDVNKLSHLNGLKENNEIYSNGWESDCNLDSVGLESIRSKNSKLEDIQNENYSMISKLNKNNEKLNLVLVSSKILNDTDILSLRDSNTNNKSNLKSQNKSKFDLFNNSGMFNSNKNLVYVTLDDNALVNINNSNFMNNNKVNISSPNKNNKENKNVNIEVSSTNNEKTNVDFIYNQSRKESNFNLNKDLITNDQFIISKINSNFQEHTQIKVLDPYIDIIAEKSPRCITHNCFSFISNEQHKNLDKNCVVF